MQLILQLLLLSQVTCEDKAVNTRSQGVIATTAASNSADEDAGDNSLMARRRRRRERAQTAYVMHGQSLDGIVQPHTLVPSTIVYSNMPPAQLHQPPAADDDVEGHQMTLAQERRMLRSAYTFHSVDNEDVFYDAMQPTFNNSAAHKQF